MTDEISNASAIVKQLLSAPAFAKAVLALDEEHARIVEDAVRLAEIPAPPFGEAEKAAFYLDQLKSHGLQDAEMDAEGNVMGLRKGTGGGGDGPVLVISAHLDTVFPKGTDVRVRRDGTKLFGPGIGDDTYSLALLLGYLRAMNRSGITTKSDVLVVGTVGEEGPGDLRGVRHLFGSGKYAGRIGGFLSVDGFEPARLVNGAVGSKRYRVTFSGPGGHSYHAFGTVNPIAAMAQAVVDFYKIEVPAKPRTTYAASVTSGGTVINAIPDSAMMEFDMRSEDPVALAALEKAFLAVIERAVEAENAARVTKSGLIKAEITPIGDRPAGKTDMHGRLVALAAASLAAHGFQAEFSYSSTDANIPMSLGIPALTIGSGITGGRTHSLEEWIDVAKPGALLGMVASFTIFMAAAGFEA